MPSAKIQGGGVQKYPLAPLKKYTLAYRPNWLHIPGAAMITGTYMYTNS